MIKLQKIFGGEKNFLFSDKKIFCDEKNFFDTRKILKLSEDTQIEESTEKTEKKSEFSKEDFKNVGEKILGDSKKTKEILEREFRKFSDRALNPSGVDGILGKFSNFEGKDIFTSFSNKAESMKNTAFDKIGILTDGNNKEYERIVFQEKQLELTLKNLQEVKEKKINSLEKTQEAAQKVKEMRGLFEKIGDGFVTAGTVGLNKVVKNWDARNARKEIEKLERIEQKMEEKLEKVQDKKDEIEGRFEKKMGDVNEIAENIAGIIENVDLSNEDREYFIQILREGRVSMRGLRILNIGFFTEKKPSQRINEIINKINNDKNLSEFDKKILQKSVKVFNKLNKTKYQDFSKTQRKMEFYEKNKDLFEKQQEIANEFEEYSKMKYGKILSGEIEVNGKKFKGKYEKNTIGKGDNEKIIFTKNYDVKDGEKPKVHKWDDDEMVIFDKEKGFVAIDKDFFDEKRFEKDEWKENEELRKDLKKKILAKQGEYEEKLKEYFDLKNDENGERKVLMKSFENFVKRFNSVDSKIDDFVMKTENKAFEKKINQKEKIGKENQDYEKLKNASKDAKNHFLTEKGIDKKALNELGDEILNKKFIKIREEVEKKKSELEKAEKEKKNNEVVNEQVENYKKISDLLKPAGIPLNGLNPINDPDFSQKKSA
ncbi:hypothetical protein LR002_03100 [Candidatus Gracilibacteria bacterium]|nr:hypothetical protein [Candidatus Gracilibacteria bacterium]